MPSSPYLLFSQQPALEPDVFALVQQARTFFKAELSCFARHFGGNGTDSWGRLGVRLQFRDDAQPVSFQLRVRWATAGDQAEAEQAELRGKAAGMATLARRCRVVWELDPAEHSERQLLLLCALLASVWLGPILPPDKSTLFGVRGARERAA